MLAFREIFQRMGAPRMGLVTPYTDDVQARIISNWRASGFICSAERHLGITDNFAFAEVREGEIERLVR
ncbi:MAG: Asp/Glu/hydantoin racemase, partial [Xanthobacteraceae bacterium]